MFHLVFYHPEIPPNTGNAIRLAANTGSTLHLIEPLGFSFDGSHVKRAGLDYHELAGVHRHADLDSAWRALQPRHAYAFTTAAERSYADIAYQPGDVLLFGPESAGLPQEVAHSLEITDRARLPMVPHSRSLNLANTAAITVYEAWRQHAFAGAAGG